MSNSLRHVPRGHKLLTVIAQMKSVPKALRLRDHSLPVDLDNSTWSAFFGLDTQRKATFVSTANAEESGRQSLVLQALFPVGELDVELAGKRQTPTSVEQTGFLHIGLVRAEFADELHTTLMQRLICELPRVAVNAAQKMSLVQLMRTYVRTAPWILDAYPFVRLLVHPMPLGGIEGFALPNGWIGTIRKELGVGMQADGRYLEHEIFVAF